MKVYDSMLLSVHFCDINTLICCCFLILFHYSIDISFLPLLGMIVIPEFSDGKIFSAVS